MVIIGKFKILKRLLNFKISSFRQNLGYNINASSSSVQRNSRSCLITLILVLIIITILSVASLIIGIYSLALNTNKSITETISSSTVSTSTTVTSNTAAICTTSPVTSYQYSSATPSQCLNYTNNSDPTRNIIYRQSINYCDNISPFTNDTSVWIRFLDPAGKVIINSPESPNRCGTVATGWYAGQYPLAAYTTATSIVCFFDSTNTCTACSSISITNCRTYFVFLLPQPAFCNYRYCTI